MDSPYRALLLDLDGTLLNSEGTIHPRNRAALASLQEHGVRVMIVTGRSAMSAAPILASLDLDLPAVIFNGAAVWCHRKGRLLEERVLSNLVVARAMDFGARTGDLTLVQARDRKLANHPVDEVEASALHGLDGVELVDRKDLAVEYIIRITFLTRRHADSAIYSEEVSAHLDARLYLTDFPLSALSVHRDSPMQVVDVHPPCRGKAEALRILLEEHGIEPEQVVAVGDATNDIPMFRAAGLSVAMGDGMAEARAAADRVIGSHETDTLADLMEEVFATAGA
jgi:Cof subfamily protein (haloacid dehalogenase superfamily)